LEQLHQFSLKGRVMRIHCVSEVQSFSPSEFLVNPTKDSIKPYSFLLQSPKISDVKRTAPFVSKLQGDFSTGENYWPTFAASADWFIDIDAVTFPNSIDYQLIPTVQFRKANPKAKIQKYSIKREKGKSVPKFQARIVVKEGQQGGGPLREWAAANSGIRVFMEGFRVLPYGERSNDWLQLDRSYADRGRGSPYLKEFGFTTSEKSDDRDALLSILPNRSYYGCVFLTQEGAPQLEMLVNREGFIPNESFESLVSLIRLGIQLRWLSGGTGADTQVVADSASNSMNVILNGGGSGGVPDFTASLPAAYNQMQIADLNGDGLPDIIATNYITQNISVFLSIRQPTQPTITLTGGASQSLAGTPQLSFSVQVTGVQSLIATGSVTLLDGTTSLGQQTLNTSGQATFSAANPATGQHNFSVSYAGDSNYLAATSNVLPDLVTDFQLSLPSSAQTVTHGATATYNLSLTPVAGFAGNVSFACSGLPLGASCASNMTSINSQPATIALNVITTSASNIHAGIRRSNVVETATLSIASFFLAILLPRRRALPKLALVLFTAIGVSLSVGCSGGSNGSTNTNNPTQVTTAFTITGSATQSGQTVSHQVSANITIN
jgi:Bacterial Ig-like domain (group 3)